MNYDIVIIGAGPGGIFSAYEAIKNKPDLKIGVFEAGNPLEQRHCPIDGEKVKACVNCPTCGIMNGFGGAGAFSDGKYNITNEFGGNLYAYVGKKEAIALMEYVDRINCSHGGEHTRLFTNNNASIRQKCLENDLHLLQASVRHLGTDINYVVLKNLFAELSGKVDFHFRTRIEKVKKEENGYALITDQQESFSGKYCIISTGRSGSKWMQSICDSLGIRTKARSSTAPRNFRIAYARSA